jgi:S1-C subfamily serine protease
MFPIKNLRACLVAIFLGYSLGTAAPVVAGDAFNAQKLYRRTILGTVFIRIKGGQASGWIIDRERRLVLTNCHVVDKDDKPAVLFPEFRDGRLIAERAHYLRNKSDVMGTVVLKDENRDLAVVSLPRLPPDAAALPLAPFAADPGQRIHAIGNPGASPALWVYTTGFVRQVVTMPLNGKDRAGLHIVVTQVPVNPGDSGGPMVDDDGRVIGVATGVFQNASLMSVAIDVSEVRVLYQRYLQQADQDVIRKLLPAIPFQGIGA